MSESEEENFCFFGKPLDPYDEDDFPKKRPITVEEQIATDAQGRRRFHGAFTGGFSAGFFNTVGSLEGWTPSEFKSTRQEKAKSIVQKPQDFMDEEDTGEYGIAPQTVKATDDYSTSKKRRKQVFSDGPIPGKPVLETLLTSSNETIGYLLMKNLGIQDKVQKQLEETGTTNVKIYGCQMPAQYNLPEKIDNKQYVVPDIYKTFLEKPKSNTFGLGYQGLDRSHVNLFTNSNLVVRDKNNKKFSIGGQAFGVGAFEDEDDDIYVKEDMSNYDFVLRKEKEEKKVVQNHGNLLFEIFKHSQGTLISKKLYPPPTIPHSFSGKHKVKKSRFEPVAEIKEEVDRHSINPEVRARHLGEQVQESHTPSKPVKDSPEPSSSSNAGLQNTSSKKSFDVSSLLVDRFVCASSAEDGFGANKEETIYGTADMREAVRMKMFGPLTRVTLEWQPCAILCKRFNVPEPLADRPQVKPKKRMRNLIFEQQKHIYEDSSLFKPGISGESSTPQEYQQGAEKTTEDLVATSTNLPLHIKTENENTDEQLLNEVIKEEEGYVSKDITDRIGIAEKRDLFKAVFLSSSESEDEEGKTEKEAVEIDKTEEFKQSLLSEELLPKIKPLKEGILSNLSFQPFVKPKIEETVSSHSGKDPEITRNYSNSNQDSLYGPKLPTQKIVFNFVKDVREVSSDSEDNWVEKDKGNKKKKRKHKKSKKKEKHGGEQKKKSHKSSH